MEMGNSEKTALLVFGSALLVYFFFVKTKIKAPGDKDVKDSGDKASADGFTEDDVAKRVPIKKPTINPKDLKTSQKVNDAYHALCAYIAAYNAGESMADLNQLVKDLKRRYSVRVYKRTDGRWAVSDSFGNDIIVNNL
jgi:hypothetical protein